MLILKNLRKTYSSKGGITVKALDDVSLTFPETGMVFLLGKSGSGKSTLLNVCGGLDTPDSGEIIVCDKSSKNFSAGDFDSYRNTFIGFIFQEYNILPEFTVEENIALALELQGKNKNEERTRDILKQVDLQGFEKRKPNTLSGGQKQRIAIARALIKDPRIIMADEPSGALDSATGKQVFDTLKKLSKNRLVIVVSHDREFAETYGDRIIELKDGKVISDVIKEKSYSSDRNENVITINEHTMSVKKGSILSDVDLLRIKNFIAGTDGDVIISNGQKDIAEFKKVNHITEDNGTESFVTTTPEKIKTRKYAAEESNFVQSKLPMRKAARLGASSLKVKPVRLVLTILLSAIAFLLFGVFSTMLTYNKNEVLISSLAAANQSVLKIGKNFQIETIEYENGKEYYRHYHNSQTAFSPAEYKELQTKYGKNTLGVYAFSDQSFPENVTGNEDTPRLLSQHNINGFAYAEEGSDYRKMIVGKYPTKNDEIAISSWYANMLIHKKVYEAFSEDAGNMPSSPIDYYNSIQKIDSINDVIGVKLNICIHGDNSFTRIQSMTFTISGVYDEGPMPEKFNGYDDKDSEIQEDYNIYSQFHNYLNDSLCRVMLVAESFPEQFIQNTGWKYVDDSINIFNYYFDTDAFFYTSSDFVSISNWYWKTYDADNERTLPCYFVDGNARKTLSGTETILPAVDYITYIMGNALNSANDHIDDWAENAKKYSQKAEKDENWTTFYNSLADITKFSSAFYFMKDYYYAANAEQMTDLCEALADYIRILNVSNSMRMINDNEEELKLSPVGFYFPIKDDYQSAYGYYVSAEMREKVKTLNDIGFSHQEIINYATPVDALYSYVYLSVQGESAIRGLMKTLNVLHTDESFYALEHSVQSQLDMIDVTIEVLSTIFLYVGIGIALFAAILLYNFISVSIHNKSHEIGVLRAVGARGSDVFKIFFAESAIITAICFVLSLVGTIALLNYINGMLINDLGLGVTLFVFGLPSLLLMIGIAVLVAVLGTMLPVRKIARKKPVDSMRGL